MRVFSSMRRRRTTITGLTLGLICWLGGLGCSTPTPSIVSPPPSVKKAVIGKTKQNLLTCAAVTPDEQTVDGTTILVFYKEAPQLEESFAEAKSSVPKVHHGCRAYVRIREERAEEILYRAVPPTYPHYTHCDEIFEPCLGR